jgi:NADPH-dependent 2,4-dienoyl-CoA reductase/sulfur reductase-like enzyme
VTVVDTLALPLQRVLGDDVGRVFLALHREHAVTFIGGASVRELRGGSRVSSVALGDGTVLPADIVVVGIGIVPNVELARDAGLDTADGVVVDASLRTADPAVFAAGDVAAAEHPLLGRRVRVEHWANALHGGPAAAHAMLGAPVTYDRLPYFFTDQYDLGMEYTGFAPPGSYDTVVFRGDPATREFIAFWCTEDGRVRAGMSVNIWDIQSQIRDLVRAGYSGRSVDLAKLADPSMSLADLIPTS